MANILIIDDHPLMLSSIKQLVEMQFPAATITTASTASVADRELANTDRDWQLVLADLSIPEDNKDPARSETGLALLRKIMKLYPDLNLMVYSSNLKVLVQLKHQIDNHRGGFTIADKTAEPTEVRRRMQYAIEGITLTKEIRKGLELKPEWLSTLQFADRGLPDKAISEQLNVTERAVRHYWTKVQDVLEIDRDNLNLRILTLNRAREVGLID
ncbi:response regulator [Chamaesiphon sp. VAR_69_metabat_338]|uniref:response regulator n=1 Tax=Chamaesiphon sp. VAR_69_metabat_338 TaxID=2964704 RepID=UPI00286DFA37|nr:response regulator [Chamaesiphon sp. VAR_69_metabat_338]